MPRKRKSPRGETPPSGALLVGREVRDSLDDAELAHLVRDAIRKVGPEGRFGKKVFISEIWKVASRDPRIRAMGIDQFKKFLLRGNRDSRFELVRADLVGAMDPHKVRDSLIQDRGATFHFVYDHESPGW